MKLRAHIQRKEWIVVTVVLNELLVLASKFFRTWIIHIRNQRQCKALNVFEHMNYAHLLVYPFANKCELHFNYIVTWHFVYVTTATNNKYQQFHWDYIFFCFVLYCMIMNSLYSILLSNKSRIKIKSAKLFLSNEKLLLVLLVPLKLSNIFSEIFQIWSYI